MAKMPSNGIDAAPHDSRPHGFSNGSHSGYHDGGLGGYGGAARSDK